MTKKREWDRYVDKDINKTRKNMSSGLPAQRKHLDRFLIFLLIILQVLD